MYCLVITKYLLTLYCRKVRYNYQLIPIRATRCLDQSHKMKKLLFLVVITGVMLTSCSKKSNPTPTKQSSNTVTINGTVYTTVVIGTQTWTTVNYNGTGGVNYNNSSTNNPNYGKLYTLAEAQAISLPSGWRLPTQTDATKLLVYLGATGASNIGADGDSTVSIKLKSKSAWTLTQGNNNSGFNAYPSGDANNGTYELLGQAAEFWTSSVDSYNDQYILGIYNDSEADGNYAPIIENDAGIDYIPTGNVSTFRMSIRFVKDN
jgi:uncharacterized protein (TIGR02145 family)